MSNLIKKIIKESIREYLNEEGIQNNFDSKLKCIERILKQEIDKYNNDNLDDRWVEIKQELRKIRGYFEDGYFSANRNDTKILMNNFLKNLNYSDNHTYKMGENIGVLPKSNNVYNTSKVDVYRAIGDKTLFRGVSLKDWERIKRQGFIDSDMRGAILTTEGINLAQILSTAMYYLPHNDKGVILAISPKNLDLYMLKDEYIRVFEPIPIENVIKVSDVFITNEHGSILTTNTEGKINDMIDRLKDIDIEINC